jgi:hypothetical protein
LRQGQYVGTQVFGSLEQGSPLKACSTVGIGHNDHCGYLTAMRWIYIYTVIYLYLCMYIHTHKAFIFHAHCCISRFGQRALEQFLSGPQVWKDIETQKQDGTRR